MTEETGRTEEQTQADDTTQAQQTQGGGAVPSAETRHTGGEHERRNGQNPDADAQEPADTEEYPAGGGGGTE
jgi:hypothetical protein